MFYFSVSEEMERSVPHSEYFSTTMKSPISVIYKLHRPELETWPDSKVKVLAKTMQSFTLYCQKYEARK